MKRQFEITIDLDCNAKEATQLLEEIIRTIVAYSSLTKVGNLVMRGNDYTTLFTMYPNDKLITLLNPPQAEPEDFDEKEVDA